MKQVKLAPSILAADFARLGEQVEEAIDAGAGHIHVDVMDGHFVPNLSVGPQVVAALRDVTHRAGVPLDVHLMVERPERFLPAFAEAGADILTVHVETCPDLPKTIQQIHDLGAHAGVTLKPATPVESLREALPLVELALVMSVDPGFGGQAYLPGSTQRIAAIRGMLDAIGSQADLSVDGGVGPENAREIVKAGATVLVAGSALFGRGAPVAERMDALRRAAQPR